jgi:hypothetical protein
MLWTAPVNGFPRRSVSLAPCLFFEGKLYNKFGLRGRERTWGSSRGPPAMDSHRTIVALLRSTAHTACSRSLPQDLPMQRRGSSGRNELVGLCRCGKEGSRGKEVVTRRSGRSHLQSAKVCDAWKPGTTTKRVAKPNQPASDGLDIRLAQSNG